MNARSLAGLPHFARWLVPLLLLAVVEPSFEQACNAAPGRFYRVRSVRPRRALLRRRYAQARCSSVPSQEWFAERVMEQLVANHPDAAMAELNRAMAAYPSSNELLEMRAMVLAAQNRRAEALTELNKLVEQNPASASAKLMKGIMELEHAFHDPSTEKKLQAIDGFAKLEHEVATAAGENRTNTDDFDGGMLLLRAGVLQNDGKFAEAVEQYTRFIDQCPKDKKHEKGLRMAYVARAWAYREAGQYARALDDYAAAIEISPEDYTGYSYKAWLLATCKDEQVRNGRLAVELATKACELSHGRPDSEGTLAAAYAELGDFKQAVEHQQKVLDAIDAPPPPKKVDKKPNSFTISLWSSAPSKKPDRRAEATARLESYNQGHPLRE